MKNEFGVPLSRNGYAPSILQDDAGERCFLCSANGAAEHLDRHEPFGGANREKSKRLGMWVSLCHESCHLYGPNSAHVNAETNIALKRHAQAEAMAWYGWSTEDFIREFEKNYLE